MADSALFGVGPYLHSKDGPVSAMPRSIETMGHGQDWYAKNDGFQSCYTEYGKLAIEFGFAIRVDWIGLR